MDNETLVEAIKEFTQELEQRFGPLSLAMLYSSMEEPVSRWNLILSSRRMDRLGVSKALTQVIAEIRRAMLPEHQRQIGRVTILKTSDPFVGRMASAFLVQLGGVINIINSTVADISIPRGIVFVSQKPRAQPIAGAAKSITTRPNKAPVSA